MTTTDQTARDVLTGILALAGGPSAAIPAAVDHILDELTAAGYAVVRLPEPDSAAGTFADWTTGVSDDLSVISDRDGEITMSGGFLAGTATTARRLAAALLAAADHQEKNQ